MKTKILFPVLVGIVAVVIGLHYFATKQELVASVPATEATSDWKTYTDSKFGYTISYPSDVTPMVKAFDPSRNVVGYDLGFGGINLKVQAVPTGDFVKFQKLTTTCPAKGPCSHELAGGTETMTTTINGIQGTSFAKNNTFFVLYTSAATTPSDKETMAKMLASFKFTK